jgi:hypothetical protein
MRGLPVLALLVLLSPGPLEGATPAKRSPADKAVDEAVGQALKFLKGQQALDGSWKIGGLSNPGITGLAIMAFLSAGHVPGEGPYGQTVEKGVRWVLKSQHPNGLIAHVGGQEMYHHGICTLMLAEVAGMTSDSALAREIRGKLVKAVQVILEAQRRQQGQHHGGWRYHIRNHYEGSDISCTGWQLLALRAAKNLGCDVPQERIQWAVNYIKRCRHPSGGFGYQSPHGLTIPCTGTSILGLEICGKNWHNTSEARKGGQFLKGHPPSWGSRFFFYGIYYCTQAMFQLGGEFWDWYRPRVHKVLLDHKKADGSWDGHDGYGPSYSTSMAVLALTVEYRYLPIYQRDESKEKAN